MSLNENKGHGTGGKLCRKQAKLAPLDPSGNVDISLLTRVKSSQVNPSERKNN